MCLERAKARVASRRARAKVTAESSKSAVCAWRAAVAAKRPAADIVHNPEPISWPAPSGLDFSVWTPPIVKAAQRLMQRASNEELEKLRGTLQLQHSFVRQSEAPALCGGGGVVRACHYAGKCLHVGGGLRLAAFERQLVATLRGLFKKGTRPRELLQAASLVFSFESSAGDHIWAHCAYTNYRTWLCMLLPLAESRCPIRPPCHGAPLIVRPFAPAAACETKKTVRGATPSPKNE